MHVIGNRWTAYIIYTYLWFLISPENPFIGRFTFTRHECYDWLLWWMWVSNLFLIQLMYLFLETEPLIISPLLTLFIVNSVMPICNLINLQGESWEGRARCTDGRLDHHSTSITQWRNQTQDSGLLGATGVIAATASVPGPGEVVCRIGEHLSVARQSEQKVPAHQSTNFAPSCGTSL